jgi:hypothetical protein
MGCFEGSGVPVLYIGRTVSKGIQTHAMKGTVLSLRLTNHAVIFLRKGILGTTTNLANSSFGCKLSVLHT